MQGKAFNSMSYPFACTIKETVNPQPWFRGTVHVQFIFPITLLFFFFFSQGHLRSRQEGRQMHQLGNCNLLLADLFSVKFRHSNLHSSCWALLLNLPDPLRLPEGSQEHCEEHRASCCCCCQGRTPTGGHNFQQALAVFNKLCQLFLITGCSVLWL